MRSFQSTLPMKGVTLNADKLATLSKLFQSTLPMKGVTPSHRRSWAAHLFQSTLPMKGVTRPVRQKRPSPQVSIHTPNEGSDVNVTKVDGAALGFNPHSQ